MTRTTRPKLFCLAVLAAACSQRAATPVDTAADEAAINALREREALMVASGNADSMLSVYTDDVKFLPANEPMVDGAAAARQWIEATFAQIGMAPKYSSSSITISGDMAVDRYSGTLTITPRAGGAPMTETIKGIHVLRKGADGSWKIAQDTWNSDTPAAPPAPPTKP
jgi:ketosteroid isomerase-like protein